ncbi:aspartyl-tRNA(Asn)/glutamyl-tRNA(Gln) amidotransferase subunit A [Marinobacter gudaonensis]|uniref:Aspartyl-tRNA(Asn)/glutamyl-tRNA(Gln) amidotransferase subunit A n=1 Tax=Marinobacter gudaonensis TaxID=375760 RepID=A0A1I6GNJ0_9GAMM|nr:amidase [Marinobacter gudaonensis]SFR43764.1 aspartyl-tRNA(Asn)/glutamyl-tRNA(Gln) amidotransferase subunit A [Marinobacter gudaonensis]
MNPITPLASLLDELASGRHNARDLLASCYSQADLKDKADARIYTRRFEQSARAEAEAVDRLRAAGLSGGQLAGLPIALKVLFDVRGEVTHAGSRGWQPPASRDARIVSRLRCEGAVLTGHTNMTEFAYSGLGLNPHYGTPENPLAPGRIPGGSSSGAAVAVALGMAAGAIGSDTGGSVRIPAAFCGLTGFKPSQSRVPRDGTFPLSDTLDSIGPIAPTVDCCARLDAVLSGHAYRPIRFLSLKGLRFVVPGDYMLDGMDDTVAYAFARRLKTLREAGATLIEAPAPVLAAIPELMEGGGFTAAESYFVHRHSLEQHGDQYDPRVSSRIKRGASISAADYLELCRRRQARKQEADQWLQDYDGLLAPTVPIVPPTFEELAADDDYARLNLLVLRNPTVANMLDLCAISLPNHAPGELPSGLMLIGRNGSDDALLRLALAIESAR